MTSPPKAPWSPGWAAFRAALRLHGGQDWGFDEEFKYGVLVFCRPTVGAYSRDKWQAIAWCQADDTMVTGTYGALRSDEFWRKRWGRRKGTGQP